MKTCMVILLLSWGVCVSAWAHPLRAYIGGSVHFVGTSEDEVRSGWDCTPPPLMTYSGMGLQLEAGPAANIWNAYIGYRHDAGHDRWNMDHWMGERFVTGTRLHVSTHYANPVKPLIGAGLSFGWGRRPPMVWYRAPDGSWHSSSAWSKGSLGWFGEAGLLLHIKSPAMLSFIVHYERLNLRFGDLSHSGGIRNVYQLSAQIGVMYELKKTFFG